MHTWAAAAAEDRVAAVAAGCTRQPTKNIVDDFTLACRPAHQAGYAITLDVKPRLGYLGGGCGGGLGGGSGGGLHQHKELVDRRLR